MYDINKRAQLETVADLKRLLADVPDETSVYICGVSGWFHIAEDKGIICLDCEDLEDCYEEENNEI